MGSKSFFGGRYDDNDTQLENLGCPQTDVLHAYAHGLRQTWNGEPVRWEAVHAHVKVCEHCQTDTEMLRKIPIPKKDW